MFNRPALGGTVPLWGKMSHVPRRPCAGRILSRFGQKSDVCDCAPHMSHAECTIVHMSEHENRTGRYTTKDRARRATKHAYTCTHVHMTLFRCQNRTVWVLAQRSAYCRTTKNTAHTGKTMLNEYDSFKSTLKVFCLAGQFSLCIIIIMFRY